MSHIWISKFRIVVVVLCCFSFASIKAHTGSELSGVWQMRGYGWIYSVDDNNIETYDTTTISCLPSNSYPITMLRESFSISGDVLTIQIGLSTYVLDKLERLPEMCSSKLSRKQKKNPLYNFDVLWNTFNEQYAYFELRDVDWELMREKYRSQISLKSTGVELYKVCYAMLAELGDGHVDIEATDKIMERAFPEAEEEEEADFKELAFEIASTYVKDLKTHNYTKSVWGKINTEVGFLQVNEMVAQAHYGITSVMDKVDAQKLYLEKSSTSSNFMQDEVDGMHKTMKNVMKNIAGVEHLIIDVRFNGGGFDAVSYEILRFLIDEPVTVFRKHARLGEGTTAPYTYDLQPIGNGFNGKVYFLQSAFSGSAAETMLLATMQLGNVTRVGASSEGILSDALEKVLPNGWVFTLSNEAYLTLEGINYEQVGIPVNKSITYPTGEMEFYNALKEQLPAGDLAIEWVLKQTQ